MMSDREKERRNALVISYLMLRNVIGFLGFTFPFILVIGAYLIFGTGMRGSLSGYYHTGMRNVFVGTLCVIGFFLFSYKGYASKDIWAGRLACLFAVGVALVPTDNDPTGTAGLSATGYLHLALAALFFLTLIYFCLFLFTLSDSEKPLKKHKKRRNRIYRICGWLMILCLVLIAVYCFLPESAKSIIRPLHPVFWLETAAILAFGFSWMTKGETLFRDR